MSDTFKHNAFTKFFSKDTRSDKTASNSPSPHSSSEADISDSPDSLSSIPFTSATESLYIKKSPELATKTLAEINDRISKRPASLVSYNSKRQKFSKRINLANSNEHVAAVCDYTGAVVAITFPAIPGRVFSYSSPLADLRNARGLAQEGKDYLRKLDVQSTAAVLITLANDYDLFRYQPSDSGAQKNAILRTVAKDILIDSILFIEEFVNSGNYQWLPKLSLILNDEVIQGGIQHRMLEWLKVSLEVVYKPDEEPYEEAMTKGMLESKKYAYKPVTNSATKRAAIALNKDFRQWKKEAKDIVIGMADSKRISLKLKTMLITLVAEQNLMLADTSMIELICERLTQLDYQPAKTLADNMRMFRLKLQISEPSEFDKPVEDTFGSQPVGSAIQPINKAEDNEFATSSIPVVSIPVSPAPATLSFKERIALLKAQQAAANVQASAPKVENDDAPF